MKVILLILRVPEGEAIPLTMISMGIIIGK